MFWAFLGLAMIVGVLAWLQYTEAQVRAAGIAAARQQNQRSHEYLKAQLPRGCINVRKTVSVSYADGLKLDNDWQDDFEKTQAIPEATAHESGMRPRVPSR